LGPDPQAVGHAAPDGQAHIVYADDHRARSAAADPAEVNSGQQAYLGQVMGEAPASGHLFQHKLPVLRRVP
jgi:hypothetical protein